MAIVTNANQNWVYYSSERLLPISHKLIVDNVLVVSARDQYQKEFPNDQARWKLEAFSKLREDMKMTSNMISDCHLIVVGDSQSEIDAAQELGKTMENSKTKTVKLSEESTFTGLTR